MTRANRQYFVVRIDKKMQEKKRNNLAQKTFGYLGVNYSKQDDDESLDGVRVWSVEPDSPAYHATLKHKDIIKKINDVPVKTYEEMAAQISKYPPGTVIEIAYINSFTLDGKISVKKIKLGEREFKIVVPPQIVDFQFNLQFGEIIAVGDIANEKFPEALIGDILIFHHAVEHKPRTEGDLNYHDFHLIETEEDGNEIRVVNFTTELFGVLKVAEKRIIPYEKFIFCHKHIVKSTLQQTSSGLWYPDSWEKSMEELQEVIDNLDNDITELKSSSVMEEKTTEKNYRRKEEIEKRIRTVALEKRALSVKMHQKKLVELTVIFINPNTCEELMTDIKPGDSLIADYSTLYPLDMYGQHYTLLRKDYIEALIPKSQN